MTTMEARGRAVSITASIELVTETCYSCGVLFAMAKEYRQKRLDDHDNFYCPNGHGQQYTGETQREKAARLERELEAQRRSAAEERRWYGTRLAERDRSLSATRGVVTKLRKRTQAGACPFGCRRHFVDLQRHVASKHAGQTFEAEAE
jgi:hypothetical protein